MLEQGETPDNKLYTTAEGLLISCTLHADNNT
jgi:hypothetical protein